MPPPNIEQQIQELAAGIAALRKSVADQRTELAGLLDRQTASVRELQDSVKTASGRMDSLLERVQKLETDVAAIVTGHPSVSPGITRPSITLDDFAQQLRTSVERLNAEVREGASQMVIDGLEVELKAGLELTDKVKLTPLLPQELKPEGLSAFRFVLRPVTTMKFPDRP